MVSVLRRPWANPLVQFLVATLLLFAATWWATGVFSERAARTEAVADARVTTDLLAHSVAEPAIPKGLVDSDPGAIDRFDREVLDRLMVETCDGSRSGAATAPSSTATRPS